LLYTLHSTLYTLHFTLYTLHFTLYTLHSTLYTLHSTLYTLHFTLYTLHSTLYTLHFTLYALHSTLYTLHSPLISFIVWLPYMKPKWNISILVIFVLLASSLLGVLAMNFVQSMMKQSATIFNSYQSYYLAKAGVELWLSELGHRGVGFEQTFTDSGFMSQNFLCAGRNTPCMMQLVLSWTSTYLSQQFRADPTGEDSVMVCQYPFVLAKWASLVIPAYKDITQQDLANNFSSVTKYQNLYPALRDLEVHLSWSSASDVTFGLLILSGDNLADNGIFFQTWDIRTDISTFLNAFESLQSLWFASLSLPDLAPYRFVFMISNSSDALVSFCLTSKVALPTQQYYLKSRWAYDQQQLWLEAIYQQPIPDFLLNGYLNYK